MRETSIVPENAREVFEARIEPRELGELIQRVVRDVRDHVIDGGVQFDDVDEIAVTVELPPSTRISQR